MLFRSRKGCENRKLAVEVFVDEFESLAMSLNRQKEISDDVRTPSSRRVDDF